MSGNLETAKDLGQGVYTQAEINNKPSGFKNLIINGGLVAYLFDYKKADKEGRATIFKVNVTKVEDIQWQ